MDTEPDKRGFQKLSRTIIRLLRQRQLPDLGESCIKLPADPKLHAETIENWILTSGGPDRLEAFKKDATLLSEAMEQVTDFSKIASFDSMLKAKLDFLGSRWFAPIHSGGEPITISSAELATTGASHFGDYVQGPVTDPAILVDVISTLRHVGRSVVGVYAAYDSSLSWIYYKPA